MMISCLYDCPFQVGELKRIFHSENMVVPLCILCFFSILLVKQQRGQDILYEQPKYVLQQATYHDSWPEKCYL